MPGKTKSTVMIDTELWKRLRIISVINEFEISEFVEEALREKLAKIQQPEQYAEYEDVKDLRYKPKGLVEEGLKEIEQPQPQSQQQNIIATLRINLPGIKFPANKNKVIEYAEKANTYRITKNLKNLPDKTYISSANLQKALKEVFKNEILSGYVIKDGKVVNIKNKEDYLKVENMIIDDREDKQQLQKRIQQQEQQLNG